MDVVGQERAPDGERELCRGRLKGRLNEVEAFLPRWVVVDALFRLELRSSQSHRRHSCEAWSMSTAAKLTRSCIVAEPSVDMLQPGLHIVYEDVSKDLFKARVDR